MVDAEPAGPDHIHVDIQDPGMQPCFIAIPKVLPFTAGRLSFGTGSGSFRRYYISAPKRRAQQPRQYLVPNHQVGHQSHGQLLHSRRQGHPFVYEGLEKGNFIAANRNLASCCTVRVTTQTYDDPIYREVIRNIRNEKERTTSPLEASCLRQQQCPTHQLANKLHHQLMQRSQPQPIPWMRIKSSSPSLPRQSRTRQTTVSLQPSANDEPVKQQTLLVFYQLMYLRQL